MKISTRTRYGMRAMVRLAEYYGKGPVQIKTIAKAEDISVKYLEQLVAALRAEGIVRSVRGAKGGYVLAKQPNQIKLNDIFTALEGPTAIIDCLLDKKNCSRFAHCVTRQVWRQISDAIDNVLGSMTLQDLADKAKDKKSLDYQI